ncbi:uncharacterized protein [Panulirus ornatus]|uniref:uncharacterized protein n=1 Tax=Panulirus ornatus TaxID=150431 RepID=UPI003A840AD0
MLYSLEVLKTEGRLAASGGGGEGGGGGGGGGGAAAAAAALVGMASFPGLGPRSPCVRCCYFRRKQRLLAALSASTGLSLLLILLLLHTSSSSSSSSILPSKTPLVAVSRELPEKSHYIRDFKTFQEAPGSAVISGSSSRAARRHSSDRRRPQRVNDEGVQHLGEKRTHGNLLRASKGNLEAQTFSRQGLANWKLKFLEPRENPRHSMGDNIFEVATRRGIDSPTKVTSIKPFKNMTRGSSPSSPLAGRGGVPGRSTTAAGERLSPPPPPREGTRRPPPLLLVFDYSRPAYFPWRTTRDECANFATRWVLRNATCTASLTSSNTTVRPLSATLRPLSTTLRPRSMTLHTLRTTLPPLSTTARPLKHDVLAEACGGMRVLKLSGVWEKADTATAIKSRFAVGLMEAAELEGTPSPFRPQSRESNTLIQRRVVYRTVMYAVHYHLLYHYVAGFWGERDGYRQGTTLLQKTHNFPLLPDEVKDGIYNGEEFRFLLPRPPRKVVLLLRNPWESLLALRHYHAAGHTGFGSSSFFRGPAWTNFTVERAGSWVKLYTAWLTLPNTHLHVIHYEHLQVR